MNKFFGKGITFLLYIVTFVCFSDFFFHKQQELQFLYIYILFICAIRFLKISFDTSINALNFGACEEKNNSTFQCDFFFPFTIWSQD